MPWSTRELAELAGTTVNTIRHYHRIGLFTEPERRYNGYKQYDVQHLVTLLRIRRLADLGVPLSQVKEVSVDADGTPDALKALDAELRMGIERMRKARREIAAILRGHAPADAPAGFESVASRLSDTDNSMIHIFTQLYDEEVLADVHKMVEADTDQVGAAIDRLPADADEATRQELIATLATTIAKDLIAYPWMRDPAAHLSKNGYVTAQTVADAVTELYNPAQLDVLARASALAGERVRAMEAEAATADAKSLPVST